MITLNSSISFARFTKIQGNMPIIDVLKNSVTVNLTVWAIGMTLGYPASVTIRNGECFGVQAGPVTTALVVVSPKVITLPTGYTDFAAMFLAATGDLPARIVAVEQWLLDQGLVPAGITE